jgi:hypothetical protein
MFAIFGELNIIGIRKPKIEDPFLLTLEDKTTRQLNQRWVREQELIRKGQTLEKRKELVEKMMDLNPNGFFECPYTVGGIQYNVPDRENLKTYNTEEALGKCMKIVSNGLSVSDPQYIGRIVYLIRHPRPVAKSQERIKTSLDLLFSQNPGYADMRPDWVVHSPLTYINSTRNASHFFLENPDIPVHFVYYDELVSNPEKVIKDLGGFLKINKRTVWSKAKHIVDPKLKRSYPQDVEHELWEESEKVYDLFSNKDYQGVIDYLKPLNMKTNQANTKWKCIRFGTPTSEKQCMECIKSPMVRVEYKKAAHKRGIDWRNSPCLYECGMDLSLEDDQVLTVEESIANNFWRPGVERLVK